MPPDDQKDRIIVSVDPDLRGLIPTFLQHRREEITLLSDALDHSDYETIKKIGHTLKGVGGGYGFDGLSEVAAFIEIAAKQENSRDVERGLHNIISYLDHVEVVYE